MVRFGTKNLMWGWLIFLPFNLQCLSWVPSHSANTFCWVMLAKKGKKNTLSFLLQAAFTENTMVFLCIETWPYSFHWTCLELQGATDPWMDEVVLRVHSASMLWISLGLCLDWGPSGCSGRGLQFPLINNVCLCLGNASHVWQLLKTKASGK